MTAGIAKTKRKATPKTPPKQSVVIPNSSAPKTIGFIGDIHCGSRWGIYPDSMLSGHPGSWVGVRYLNECFNHLVAKWPKLDLLILMGDLIDGRQGKSESTGLFSANLGEQVQAAIETLTPLAKKSKKILRVDGTPHHEGFHNALLALDYALGVHSTSQVFDIELLPGKVLNVAHHPSGGSALYTGTKVDRDSLWAKVAAVEGKVPLPRWIVRAHIHQMLIQLSERMTAVQLPCFQLATPYAKKSNYWRWTPSIGGMLMVLDPEDFSGYKFMPSIYDPPMPNLTTMNELYGTPGAKL